MRVVRILLVFGLAAVAGLAQGCATCDPEKPKVEPRVGGTIGSGSGGTWTSTGVGFDVTNLFCRAPEPETETEPEDSVPEG